jgi:hypothetical protein
MLSTLWWVKDKTGHQVESSSQAFMYRQKIEQEVRQQQLDLKLETVSTTADKAKLAGCSLVGGLGRLYVLSKRGQLAQWNSFLVGLAAARSLCFCRQESGRQLVRLDVIIRGVKLKK